MTDFQLSTSPYVALASRKEVRAPSDCPIHLVVYAPGTACADWRYHKDNAALVSYGFLAYWRDAWSLMGETCLRSYFASVQTQPWKTALDNRHPLAGAGLPDDWRASTRRGYWRLVKLMGLMAQVEPREKTRGLLHGYIEWAARDKAEFSRGQKIVLLEILRERGVRTGEDWGQELAAHGRILKARRDLAFRLARLAAFNLSTEDRIKVESLQAQNIAWRNGRMASLSKKQVRLILALEAEYLEQRLEAAKSLAQTLAREFKLESPAG